jgi:hypothetical protein
MTTPRLSPVSIRTIVTKALCTLSRRPNGTWLVRYSSSALGTVEVSAPSRDEVLTKMRDELQYRSEWCPCSGASGDSVELQVTDDSSPARRG